MVNTADKEKVRQLDIIPHPKMADPMLNSLVTLTLETLKEDNSVLIFCSSRLMAVETAVRNPIYRADERK